MITKVCSKCGNEFPATSEFFHKTKSIKSGFRPECKICYHQYYLDNKENWRRYREEHKEEIIQKQKEYVEKNKDKIIERTKKYRELRKEELSQKRKDYTAANKERVYSRKRELRLINLEREHDRINKYNASEIGRKRTRLNAHKRRARSKNITVDYDIKKWEECKTEFNNICCYCGKADQLTQDHFIPLSKGGEYTTNNIIPACKSCNSSKNNRGFFEWYTQQKFYSKKREQKILKYLNYDTKTQYQQLALC